MRHCVFSEKQSRMNLMRQCYFTRVTPENFLVRTISRRQLPRFPLSSLALVESVT